MSVATKLKFKTVNGDVIVPIFTLISALVVIILSSISMASNGQNNSLQQFYTFELNTSTFLQDAIKFRQASSSESRAGSTSAPDLASTSGTQNPRNSTLPANPSVFLSESINQLTKVFDTAFKNTAESPGLEQLRSPEKSVISDIINFGNQFTNTATNIVENGIKVGANAIVSEILHALGVRQWYGLYLGAFCSGDFKDKKVFKELGVVSCSSTQKTTKSREPEDTIQIGNTIVDFSALNLVKKFTMTLGLLSTFLKSIFVVEIVGVALCALVFLLSPLLFINRFRTFKLRLCLGILALTAAVCFGVVAVVQTIIGVLVKCLVSQLGSGLGIRAESGRRLLSLLWINFGLMIVSSMALLAQCFKEVYVRKSTSEIKKQHDSRKIISEPS
ncbi:BgTH12-01422 [Blumeria graminis f. sp. triticale]|uniref:BgTH12-01422 n=1 Tax=Blumeria graminis f. sp. triticale TaxID=1689686 RepID=A0A9W4CYP8_BLUGR|nr:BgTH12-01422 [Blumeria graminis f. sp. triticale]